MATKTKDVEIRARELAMDGLSVRKIPARLEAEGYGVQSKSSVHRWLSKTPQDAPAPVAAPAESAPVVTPAALADAYPATAAPDLVDDNPWQPRRHRTPEKDEELLESIATEGLIQRPIARPMPGGRYQIVVGHRRRDAMAELVRREDPRWPHAGVLLEVQQIDDGRAAAIALQENTVREDLTQMEKVRAWQRMLDEIPGMTQDRIAQIAGLGNRSTVANYLRLLSLPSFILDLVDEEEMPPRAAREFLALHDTGGEPNPRVEMMQYVVDQVRKSAVRGSWAPDAKANFSVKSVRWYIADAVQFAGQGSTDHFGGGGRDQKLQWRPIDGGGYQSGNDRLAWPHDTEAFAHLNPHTIYRIPLKDSDGSRRWTSDAVSWHKWRDRTAASARKNYGSGSAEKAKDAGSSRPGAHHPPEAARHPLVAAKTREAKGETPWDELGTLAQPVFEFDTFRRNSVVAKLQSQAKNEDSYGIAKLPSWFDDPKECTERCTIGARFGRDGYDRNKTVMVCTNAQHFKEKLAASRAKVEPHVKAQVKQEELLRGLLADALQPAMPSGPAGAMAAALMLRGTYGIKPKTPFDHASYEPFDYTPRNTARIAEIAGVQLRDGSVARDTIYNRIADVPAELVQELAARVMVAVVEESMNGARLLKELADKLGVPTGTDARAVEDPA
jgi:ParB/RepB/Spo0J family partition protein